MNNKVYILTITPDDANFGPEIIGVYKTIKKARVERSKIIRHYIRYNEAYDVTRDDAVAYYNFEIREYDIE